ncbi:MAG: hypothetical protein WC707_06910 [Candidatus Babeliaceae bacterium]|jgi:hypothetical protein
MEENKISENEISFVNKMLVELTANIKYHKIGIEKIATGFQIFNKNKIKELTELAIVLRARQIANETISNFEKYKKIVALYNKQANLSQRTSTSMLLQQYSTPAPISYIASLYVYGFGINDVGSMFFEPSAGNGLLTIALPMQQTIVNELDEIRLANLQYQSYLKVTNQDATIPFTEYYKKFSGVVTNPPFGTLLEAHDYDGYKIITMDHLMSLRALDCMQDNGRAAIIIGGHTTWDDKGRTQQGKNSLFLNYLYSHYNVDDIILIDGHKLYSRQGTAFDTRLILIDGRKTKTEGFAPLKNSLISEVMIDFTDLWNRVFDKVDNLDKIKENLKLKMKLKAATLELGGIVNEIDDENIEKILKRIGKTVIDYGGVEIPILSEREYHDKKNLNIWIGKYDSQMGRKLVVFNKSYGDKKEDAIDEIKEKIKEVYENFMQQIETKTEVNKLIDQGAKYFSNYDVKQLLKETLPGFIGKETNAQSGSDYLNFYGHKLRFSDHARPYNSKWNFIHGENHIDAINGLLTKNEIIGWIVNLTDNTIGDIDKEKINKYFDKMPIPQKVIIEYPNL